MRLRWYQQGQSRPKWAEIIKKKKWKRICEGVNYKLISKKHPILNWDDKENYRTIFKLYKSRILRKLPMCIKYFKERVVVYQWDNSCFTIERWQFVSLRWHELYDFNFSICEYLTAIPLGNSEGKHCDETSMSQKITFIFEGLDLLLGHHSDLWPTASP